MRNPTSGGLTLSHRLAVLVPLALVGGAWISQLGFGLHPCEMCLWQRWPHYAAIALAIAAVMTRGGVRRGLVLGAGLLILVSGIIGVFHAGVEYGWWEGLTRCATASSGGGFADIMNRPITRCDAPAWTLAGISLAGYNALISIGSALAIGVLWTRGR